MEPEENFLELADQSRRNSTASREVNDQKKNSNDRQDSDESVEVLKRRVRRYEQIERLLAITDDLINEWREKYHLRPNTDASTAHRLDSLLKTMEHRQNEQNEEYKTKLEALKNSAIEMLVAVANNLKEE